MPYDVQKDFAPIGLVVSLQNIIVVHPSLPAKNLKDYLALAKAKPGDMLYASSGSGSPGHLAAVLLESMTGVQMTHVPYKGGGPPIIDLVAGHVPSFFAVISTGVPHVRSGKIRPIAVTGAKRAEALPDVPTVAEVGRERLRRDELVRHARARRHAGARSSSASTASSNAALKAPDVVAFLKDNGIDAAPSSPAEFAQLIQAEQKKWTPIIRKSNIKVVVAMNQRAHYVGTRMIKHIAAVTGSSGRRAPLKDQSCQARRAHRLSERHAGRDRRVQRASNAARHALVQGHRTRGHIENGKVAYWQVTIKVGFTLEE